MQTVTTIGLDIAKSVFQVHGIDSEGKAAVRLQLKRCRVLAFFKKLPPCLVGIEACASSHHWARELTALGHEVKLMPPAYVKPYVKRQKNDAADAEAICEAVQRPSMRFVPIKAPDQQAGLVLHRTRHLLMRQQTAVINAIRLIWPSSGSWHPSGVTASSSSSELSMIAETIAFPNSSTRVSPSCAFNLIASRKRSVFSTGVSTRGIDRARPASGSTPFREWVQHSQPHSSPALPIRRRFALVVTSRPGSGSSRSRTRAAARRS